MSGAAGATRDPARWAAALVLLLVAMWLLCWIGRYGQERFFTVDEYQYAHATWLVAQGERPYVDFYEHHFPASYVLHAPLLPPGGTLAERALFLRAIPSVYLVGLALALAGCSLVATRDPLIALLSAILPLGFGFSLMSAVDYRADNFAGFLFVGALAGLEANRRAARRGVAALCGVLFALAVLMTQKMVLMAGGTALLLLAADRMLRERGAPRVAAPGAFVAAGASVGGIALAVAASLGLLGPGFEITVRQAIAHESVYPAVGLAEFAGPYLRASAWTTLPLLALAAVHVATRRDVFWALPLAVSVAVGVWLRAQYPYNYVVPCLLLGICAARGAATCVDGVLRGRAPALRSLLLLAPLVLLPDQVGFAAAASRNLHQLHLLDKLERFSAPDDAVIDGAGGAMFRPHASYYWYHGDAHRELFRTYFEEQLVDDYRASAAPFWIADFRQRKLPAPVQDYFAAHYVRADGALYALGQTTPATPDAAFEGTIDVLRPGTWRAYAGLPRGGGAAETAVFIGGRRLGATGLALTPGRHVLRVEAGEPSYVVTPHPRAVFEDRMIALRPYAPLFEYARAARIRGGASPGPGAPPRRSP